MQVGLRASCPLPGLVAAHRSRRAREPGSLEEQAGQSQLSLLECREQTRRGNMRMQRSTPLPWLKECMPSQQAAKRGTVCSCTKPSSTQGARPEDAPAARPGASRHSP